MRGLEPTIRRRPRRRTGEESGFTLIEVLVALSVFSLAVMALLNVQGQNTRTAGLVATRVVAGVVAENRAVEAVLGTTPLTMGVTEGVEIQAGRLWRWTRRISATADRDILRIDLSVRPDGSLRSAAELTVFRGRS